LLGPSPGGRGDGGEVIVMKRIRDRVAGLDVHRDTVVACCRVWVPGGGVELSRERFETTRAGLAELAAFLLERAVTTVAMEATGVYWKPVYYTLEGLFAELWLCNAQHVKNVPGRKSDLSDAEWLADVAAHGMVRPSFVPPPAIRELRELTRYRKTQADARVKEIQRLEKVLQDAGVKLTSVASAVWSVSSREMIEALIAGERDPALLAQHAKGKMRAKIGRLEQALAGSFGAHHAVVCRQIIEHIDFLDASIAALNAEIAARLVPFEPALAILESITGISRTAAEVIVAETGADMSRFPSAGHLCAWAGLAPASYESAGKRRPAGSRHGSSWLRRTLIEAARAGARSKNSYFSAQYARIARGRGPNRAAVAVAHSMLAVAWHLLTTGALYQDPGGDYFQRRLDPAAEAKRLTRRIEALGYDVTLTEKAAA
jgi:transposase